MTTAKKRIKVAVLADDFNPEWPSLPIVGYKYATSLAKYADVTVYTQIRNKVNLEKANHSFKLEYIDTEYIASPIFKFAKWLRRGAELGWTIQMASNYLPYLEFERRVLRRIRLSKIRFDVVHRITPMSPTLPSYVSGRTSAPFVVGPLNGNLPWPAEYIAERRRERESLSKFKRIYKVLPFARSTYARAAAILAAFPHTVGSISRSAASKVIDMPEIGYDPAIFNYVSRDRTDELTFLYAGRLVPYKLPEATILAFALKPELRKHRLRIVGAGPERDRLEKLVSEHNLHECVRFVGSLAQRDVAEEMRKADVFLFPSIRELGAGVIIEALACGLPCVVADYGAPGALINEERGRKVSLSNREAMIKGFADAAADLASRLSDLDRMAEACARYAQDTFTWDKKALATIEVYDWVLGKRERKPDFTY